MGNRTSRLDRYYSNYEKTLDSLQQDVVKLQSLKLQRGKRLSGVRFWCNAAVICVTALSAVLVYQVQQRPGLSYDLHLRLMAAALCLPLVVLALSWLLQLLYGMHSRRLERKIKQIEDAKRKMVKELKDMCQFDKAKALIERFDPDAQKFFSSPQFTPGMRPGKQRGPPGSAAAAGGSGPGRPAPGGVLLAAPPMVAGAAASAVAGAGRALMPLLDKLAAGLIADNPVLVEDLRRAQGQLMEAESRVAASLHESQYLKAENDHLKGRLGELEEQLGLPRTYPLPLAADPAEVGTPTAAAAAGGSEPGDMDTPAEPGLLSQQGSLQQAAEEPLEPLEGSPQVRRRRA